MCVLLFSVPGSMSRLGYVGHFTVPCNNSNAFSITSPSASTSVSLMTYSIACYTNWQPR